MSRSEPTSILPASALREFTKWAKADWEGGVPLSELLERINRVAECLPSGSDGPEPGTGRVSRIFTERAFRHYQTLGCVDTPEKQGRNASYGYRHFLQALLIRRLLADGVPVRRMPELTTGNTDELKRMILGGVEMVARTGGEKAGESVGSAPVSGLPESWSRIQILSGIELHVRPDMPRLKPEELQRVMELVKRALRGVVG